MTKFIRIKDTIISIENIEEIIFHESDETGQISIKAHDEEISFLYNKDMAEKEFERIEKILCGDIAYPNKKHDEIVLKTKHELSEEKRINHLLQTKVNVLSKLDDVGLADLREFLSEKEKPIENLEKQENILSPREFKVIRMRYGETIELGKTIHTLEEVAKEFDCTRERIRQIERKALGKLNFIKNK